jgi:hypothetical protein
LRQRFGRRWGRLADVERLQLLDDLADHAHVKAAQDQDGQADMHRDNRGDRLCPVGPVSGSGVARHSRAFLQASKRATGGEVCFPIVAPPALSVNKT